MNQELFYLFIGEYRHYYDNFLFFQGKLIEMADTEWSEDYFNISEGRRITWNLLNSLERNLMNYDLTPEQLEQFNHVKATHATFSKFALRQL